MIQQLKEQFATPRVAGKSINTLVHISPDKAGRFAFHLFCSPRKGRQLKPKEINFLEGATQIDLHLGEISLKSYYWKAGNETVLLAHGYESNSARWRALVPFLMRSGFSVVAVDAPAHGLSGSDTVNGVLYAQALDLVIKHFSPHYAIGHSFGGMSLAYYFSTFSYQTIDKLMLMATPSRLRNVTDLFSDTLALSEKSQKAMDDHFSNHFGFTIDDFTVGDFIKSCRIPGLIIHDAEDTVAPIEGAHQINNSWESSELKVTKGLGHFLQSGEVYKTIVDFLR